ncbi:hypothetical protein QR680_003150 [Steinernema hermaphroditum]|uniref:Uncharacterized protein n=1 Tax=Steinernema hermaphroditum TaxID=289476 RepID=A0AA39H863_9BILA|nr:hypothetical protein QR680_003150 [Steinernema hermaphroditum]
MSARKVRTSPSSDIYVAPKPHKVNHLQSPSARLRAKSRQQKEVSIIFLGDRSEMSTLQGFRCRLFGSTARCQECSQGRCRAELPTKALNK